MGCPARLDVHTNLIDTDDYEAELQMAAATWEDASQVRVAPPQNFVAPHPEGEGSKNPENVILAYDTADDSDDATLDYSDSEQRDASETSQRWKTTPTFRSTGPPGYLRCPTQSSSTRLRLSKLLHSAEKPKEIL